MIDQADAAYASGDHVALRDLGLALVDEGDLAGAERALREALRLGDDAAGTRASLAHVVYATGQIDEAVDLLSLAAAQTPDDPEPLRNLVEMCRASGRTRAALEAAEALAAREPDDVLTLIDLAELHLALGDFDQSLEAYRRLRDTDPEPGHAAYVYLGMIEVEMRRERWRRAMDLAISASAVDRHQLTTDVFAFVTAKLFGESDRPVPPRAELEQQVEERRAGHRRLHLEALLP